MGLVERSSKMKNRMKVITIFLVTVIFLSTPAVMAVENIN